MWNMDPSLMTQMMGTGVAMMFLPVLLIALLVTLVAWTVRRSGEPTLSVEPPLVSLQRRYARGEIDRDEYLRIRTDLA
jgi:uncharacterized membrane protein